MNLLTCFKYIINLRTVKFGGEPPPDLPPIGSNVDWQLYDCQNLLNRCKSPIDFRSSGQARFRPTEMSWGKKKQDIPKLLRSSDILIRESRNKRAELERYCHYETTQVQRTMDMKGSKMKKTKAKIKAKSMMQQSCGQPSLSHEDHAQEDSYRPDTKHLCRSTIINYMKWEEGENMRWKTELSQMKDERLRLKLEQVYQKKYEQYNHRLLKMIDVYHPNVAHVERKVKKNQSPLKLASLTTTGGSPVKKTSPKRQQKKMTKLAQPGRKGRKGEKRRKKKKQPQVGKSITMTTSTEPKPSECPQPKIQSLPPTSDMMWNPPPSPLQEVQKDGSAGTCDTSSPNAKAKNESVAKVTPLGVPSPAIAAKSQEVHKSNNIALKKQESLSISLNESKNEKKKNSHSNVEVAHPQEQAREIRQVAKQGLSVGGISKAVESDLKRGKEKKDAKTVNKAKSPKSSRTTKALAKQETGPAPETDAVQETKDKTDSTKSNAPASTKTKARESPTKENSYIYRVNTAADSQEPPKLASSIEVKKEAQVETEAEKSTKRSPSKTQEIQTKEKNKEAQAETKTEKSTKSSRSKTQEIQTKEKNYIYKANLNTGSSVPEEISSKDETKTGTNAIPFDSKETTRGIDSTLTQKAKTNNDMKDIQSNVSSLTRAVPKDSDSKESATEEKEKYTEKNAPFQVKVQTESKPGHALEKVPREEKSATVVKVQTQDNTTCDVVATKEKAVAKDDQQSSGVTPTKETKPKPTEWIACEDDQNQCVYYYNLLTEECQWTCPPNFSLQASQDYHRDEKLKALLKSAFEGTLKKNAGYSKAIKDKAQVAQVAMAEAHAKNTEHWVEAYDPTCDAFYYYESTSGLSVWEKPATYVMSADDKMMCAAIKIQCLYRSKKANARITQLKQRNNG